MDFKISNSSYTWFGPKGKCSKLERFLLNESWLNQGLWKVSSLCRQLSDHKAIFLQADQTHWGPRPFRSFNWWLHEEEVKLKIESFWHLKKSSSENFRELLRSLKHTLKEWNQKGK